MCQIIRGAPTNADASRRPPSEAQSLRFRRWSSDGRSTHGRSSVSGTTAAQRLSQPQRLGIQSVRAARQDSVQMPGTHFCFFPKTSLPAGGRFHMEPRIFCDKRLVRVFTSFTRATPICSSRNGMLRRWKRSLGIKAWFAVFLLFQILHHDSAGCPTHWDVATKAWFAALLLFQIPHHDPASSPTQRDIVTKA